MTVRLVSALVLPFFLVGASWPQGWYPKYGTGFPSRGLPSVYVRLAPSALETAAGEGPARVVLAAVTDRNTAPALPVPRIEGLRISKGRDKFGIIVDLSNRTDFWYWTAIDQSEVVIEFPSIQAFNGKALNTGVEDLVGVIKFEVYQTGRGGRVVVPLKRPGIVQSILLQPDKTSGRHRLVVEVGIDGAEKPPSNGQGMAWGGGREIDRVNLFRARKKGVTLTPAKASPTGKPAVRRSAEIAKPAAAAATESKVMPAQPVKPVAVTPAGEATASTAPKPDPSPEPLMPVRAASPAERQAAAQALSSALAVLAQSHKRILAATADLEAARRAAAVARGSWYPTLDITAFYGYEIQRKDEGVDETHMPTHEIDFKITQLMWDFGATGSAIEQAGLAVSQAEVALEATVQAVLLEGISAHLNYARAQAVLAFARRSEDNIKRQAEVEDIRVRRGSGFSSDVLQAKVQLAGAEARRVQAAGLLVQSANRYNALFGTFPDAQVKFINLDLKENLLPAALEDAVQSALDDNPQIRAIGIANEIARAATRGAEAGGYYPKLNLITEAKYKQDVAGTIGFKGEQIVRVELTFPFNLGGTSADTLQASKQAFLSSESRLGDAKDQIGERARVAWQQLETAREVAAFLHNQADIAAEFLGLARKERELGKRTLIELLAGETALINAAADAASAEIDVSIAAFTLLGVMGNLSAEAVVE